MKSEIRNNQLKGMKNMIYSTKAEINGPKFMGLAARQIKSRVAVLEDSLKFFVQKFILF